MKSGSTTVASGQLGRVLPLAGLVYLALLVVTVITITCTRPGPSPQVAGTAGMCEQRQAEARGQLSEYRVEHGSYPREAALAQAVRNDSWNCPGSNDSYTYNVDTGGITCPLPEHRTSCTRWP